MRSKFSLSSKLSQFSRFFTDFRSVNLTEKPSIRICCILFVFFYPLRFLESLQILINILKYSEIRRNISSEFFSLSSPIICNKSIGALKPHSVLSETRQSKMTFPFMPKKSFFKCFLYDMIRCFDVFMIFP